MTSDAYAVSVTFFVRATDIVEPDVLICELLDENEGLSRHFVTYVIDDINLWTPPEKG